MYAVIKTGGKQYKVQAGDVIEVERIKIKGDDTTVTLTPLLVVGDDGKTISGAKDLGGYSVAAKVVGDTKGDKVTVFKYRNKSGYKSKTGHRQQYSLLEITSIGGDDKDQNNKAESKQAETSAADDSGSVESNGS